jgi:hypothetical protein
MNDDLWRRVTPRQWNYTYSDPNRWMPNTVQIIMHTPFEWAFHVNAIYIATFPSWEEARDATPMLLKLHGTES